MPDNDLHRIHVSSTYLIFQPIESVKAKGSHIVSSRAKRHPITRLVKFYIAKRQFERSNERKEIEKSRLNFFSKTFNF